VVVAFTFFDKVPSVVQEELKPGEPVHLTQMNTRIGLTTGFQ